MPATASLHELAEAERVSLLVVGSTHTGSVLHGAPCAVAGVPRDYRDEAAEAVRRIGVACNETDEGRQAVQAAARVAQALGVVGSRGYSRWAPCSSAASAGG